MNKDELRRLREMVNRRHPKQQFGYTYTSGTFSTEDEAKAEFLRRMGATDAFHVYDVDAGEVLGYLAHRMPGCLGVYAKVDYIVRPLRSAIDAGWTAGPFGVEVKQSGVKIAPVTSQMTDYRRTVWRVKRTGEQLWLDQIFLWPSGRLKGDIESIFMQNRLGYASSSSSGGITFLFGGCCPLRIEPDGGIVCRVSDVFLKAGRKSGNRGEKK